MMAMVITIMMIVIKIKISIIIIINIIILIIIFIKTKCNEISDINIFAIPAIILSQITCYEPALTLNARKFYL